MELNQVIPERKVIGMHCDESSHELLDLEKDKCHKFFLGLEQFHFLHQIKSSSKRSLNP